MADVCFLGAVVAVRHEKSQDAEEDEDESGEVFGVVETREWCGLRGQVLETR